MANKIKIGSYKISERSLYKRIVDKISNAMFNSILKEILCDLDYERNKRSTIAKKSTPKRLNTLKKNKENS